jgi:hypothetical protein
MEMAVMFVIDVIAVHMRFMSAVRGMNVLVVFNLSGKAFLEFS